MPTAPLQLSDVIYNAATQSFEALVTLHDNRGSRTYACAIDAPINMNFEDAAARLAAQAKRRHNVGRADSVHIPPVTDPQRTERIVAQLRRLIVDRFDTEHPRAA
ncbi:orotidine 5-phosphate decarboxylase [Tateyamaria pelophila]|uniref:orotidine 5-phosphate decarboxylase n=1 Tax=Tateyamaria pelophila TaxID=328415 RepID=UPI001CBDCFEE|nr:orotidine 5-phosphate decarboxylase [Tateyamaria pelophila]